MIKIMEMELGGSLEDLGQLKGPRKLVGALLLIQLSNRKHIAMSQILSQDKIWDGRPEYEDRSFPHKGSENTAWSHVLK